MEKLIVYDLDGTLTESKSSLDKAYGIRKLRDILGISLKEMIFIGDALFPGGNDYPAEKAGVVSIPVRGPNETKRVTDAIIAFLDRGQQAFSKERIL
jgi:hydroxymethylpyrimidine pyrophosphatase-like HAD family hydrolase